jgi:uncharacterized protein involved in oxidation of intracellular sulfur
MKLGIIISQKDHETVWNAYRLGIFSLKQGDSVKTFLIGKGVESETKHQEFNVKQKISEYIKAGGEIYACGSCIKLRKIKSKDICQISTMKDLYNIIKESDKIVSF